VAFIREKSPVSNIRNMKANGRNAWLITWESSRRDYLQNLARPRVVRILRAQIQEPTVCRILPALWLSESKLSFSEKLNFVHEPKLTRDWLTDEGPTIRYGGNPWLLARKVSGTSSRDIGDNLEDLHWVEPPWYAERQSEIVEIVKPLPRFIRSDSLFRSDDHFIGG
jgi:hypothetical protein